MGTRVFVFFLLLLATPVFAVDLVDVSLIGPVTVLTRLSDPVLGSPPPVWTGPLDQGESELLQVGPLGVLIEVSGGAVQATLDRALNPSGRVWFSIPTASGSVAMPSGGGSTTPLIVTYSGLVQRVEIVGRMGGQYSARSGTSIIGIDTLLDSGFPLKRQTVFVIPGDTITWGQADSCVGNETDTLEHCPVPVPGVPVDVIRFQTTAMPPPPTPECSDGLDNDGDGAIDLADKQCKAAADNSESQGGIQ